MSLLSPTQDHINDLRPPGGPALRVRPTLTDGDASRAKGVTSNARTLTERDVSHKGGPVEGYWMAKDDPQGIRSDCRPCLLRPEHLTPLAAIGQGPMITSHRPEPNIEIAARLTKTPLRFSLVPRRCAGNSDVILMTTYRVTLEDGQTFYLRSLVLLFHIEK